MPGWSHRPPPCPPCSCATGTPLCQFVLFSSFVYEEDFSCAVVPGEFCSPKCVKSDRYDYCYYSRCPEPKVKNAEITVGLHEYRGETFKVKCKSGYVLPYDDQYLDTINCDQKGRPSRTVFDCIPKQGDFVYKIGSAHFKCRNGISMVSPEGSKMYVHDFAQGVRTCLDECALVPQCR